MARKIKSVKRKRSSKPTPKNKALYSRVKAAAKRKFDVYPSAYANMYASGVCSGKITPGGKKGSRKKAMGGGMMDMTRMRYLKGGQV